MAIVNERLKTTELNVLTVPPGKSYAITNILVCNHDFTNGGLDAQFDMHFVAGGGGIVNSKTIVIKELVLPVGETFTFDSERIILEENDTLTFVAEPAVDGNANTDLSVTVSYLEV
jgi:hypothetical protein